MESSAPGRSARKCRGAGHRPTIPAATRHLFGFTVHDTFGMADGEIRMADPGAITVTLTTACDTSRARQIPSDQPGTQRFEHPLSLLPRFTGLRFCTFPGGCATYRFSFAPGAPLCWPSPPTARSHSCPADAGPGAVTAQAL